MVFDLRCCGKAVSPPRVNSSVVSTREPVDVVRVESFLMLATVSVTGQCSSFAAYTEESSPPSSAEDGAAVGRGCPSD